MEFSKFSKRFTGHSGIVQLMEDLGDAMESSNDVFMLGGGNPAHIPEMEAFFIDRMQRIVETPAVFSHIIGDYDPPGGEKQFLQALAKLFNDECGWEISSENIAITTGSQSAFFMLFNMFAGEFADGSTKKILLPLAPEYIGYSDVGLTDNLFVSNKPRIETFDDNTFKYHIDFDTLKIESDINAICVSRPTNPSGNVLTDEEVSHLHQLSVDYDIPFIIDNAYGMPFPNIIFTDTKLIWDQNIILCMSLSKLGLPGTRTGIVIANNEIIEAITRMNAIFSLSVGSFGPALAIELITSGEIIRLSKSVIKPFYEKKSKRAVALLKQELEGLNYYIHKAEGALFIWLWLPGLPITSEELYERLKQRGVLVLSGHYFFPGLDEEWEHKHECLRITYSMQDDVVSEGIKLIAEEIRKVFQ